MTSETSARTMHVHLPISVVEALLNLRAALDDDLITTINLSLTGTFVSDTSSLAPVPQPALIRGHVGYEAEYLGIAFTAPTLPEVLARIVDMTAEVAPEVLIDFAKLRARKRRYVARTREGVHPDNQHLPVKQTDSGWWISKNIGREDLLRTLRALCRTSGLIFGEDLRFPLQRTQ